MSKPTIKELLNEIKTLKSNIKFWQERSEYYEKGQERAENRISEVRDDFTLALRSSEESNYARGRYDGYSEATKLLTRSEEAVKYEIDQRVAKSSRRPDERTARSF